MPLLCERIRCNHRAVCRKKFNDLQLSARNGSGLVTKENIQRACRLNPYGTAHEHPTRKHTARILHEHKGDHQRQPLRNRTDDDEDSKRDRLNGIHEDLLPPHHNVCLKSACTQGEEHHIE